MLMWWMIQFYRFFCSLKLAVCIISVLIFLLAIGTVYESLYGRLYAQEVIYQSVWMTFVIILLALNIVAVMIDRWPWKKKHIAFLMAHFGILFVCAGSLITRYYGIDGNLSIKVGESQNRLMTSNILLSVYSSFDGKNLTQLYQKKVHFFKNPPHRNRPYRVPLGSSVLRVIDYYPSSIIREQYKSTPKGGIAIRFQISGKNAEITHWMFKPPWKKQIVKSLGPSQIILLDSFNPSHVLSSFRQPTLLLVPVRSKKKANYLQYKLCGIQKNNSRSAKSVCFKTGFLKLGSILKTGWMDFQFRLLSYIPQAIPDTIFIPQKLNAQNTSPAIQLEFNNQKQWMSLNSHVFFFDKSKVFIVAYANEQKKLNFNIKLKKFTIQYYPSSLQASSYKSQVVTQYNWKKQHHTISMNHPIKLAGYTIYQSGFEEDERGTPLTSIFAINKDPGRQLKYLGCILIACGVLLLFLRRNRRSRNVV